MEATLEEVSRLEKLGLIDEKTAKDTRRKKLLTLLNQDVFESLNILQTLKEKNLISEADFNGMKERLNKPKVVSAQPAAESSHQKQLCLSIQGRQNPKVSGTVKSIFVVETSLIQIQGKRFCSQGKPCSAPG